MPTPSGFRLPLRDYQRRTLKWLMDLEVQPQNRYLETITAECEKDADLLELVQKMPSITMYTLYSSPSSR